MATKAQAKIKTKAGNSPGNLVLQWLTYAFWGWTILALAWLTAISVGFFLNPSSTSGYESTIVAYSLAAVIVLFVISLICDIFYSRHEPLQKQGAAMVIMIIHAVVFALFGIGALIVAVFAVVRLLIGDSDGSSYGDSGAMTMLITGLIISLVYGATLLRTLRPFKLSRSNLVYWVFMGLVSASVVALAIAGPTWSARQTRDDRLIERALPAVSESIRTFTAKNDKLPESLGNLSGLSPDAQELVDRNLVEYTPGKPLEADAETKQPLTPEKPIVAPGATAYSYTLCVTYEAQKNPSNMYYAEDTLRNSVSPETYSHESGRVCYDLVTAYSGRYY